MNTQAKNLVIGNWKLHGSQRENISLIKSLKSALDNLPAAEFVVCPPYVYLPQVGELIQGSNIMLGAQNVSDQESGAFTGEVSAAMLAELSCRYVIVGHMERRTLYSEDNALIARKYTAVQKAGLVPILCVGETLEQHRRGETQTVIAEQLQSCLSPSCDSAPIIAYEPGWAIGTGQSATPEQILEVHRFISDFVSQLIRQASVLPRVVYGGSIKTDNARMLFDINYVNGALVGGASLDALAFGLIAQAACKGAA